MGEWLSYSLSDFLLFSPRTYYRLFELYNLAIWPAQIVALAIGLAILALWHHRHIPALWHYRHTWHSRAIAALLAACWLWVAWAFLLQRYDSINWAGKYFAAGFALEALLLMWSGTVRDRLALRQKDIFADVGFCLFVFALFVQPLIGPLLGRPWTQAEIFAVAPDPSVVATLGFLLATKRPQWPLLVLPLLWCAISGATLWTMQSPDAWVLPIAAVIVFLFASWKTAARVHQV